jgi:hypothetical protein
VSPLRIELANAPIEAVAAELAVVAFFELEALVAGSAGRVDWRLCGALSRLALQGEVRGACGEATLVPSGGGIAAPLVLVLGLGPRAAFDRDALERFAAEALDRSRRLRARSVALGWPTRLAIPPSEQVDALLLGLAASSQAATLPETLRVVGSASEAAALAEALRGRSGSLPPGLTLAAPLLAPAGPRALGLASRGGATPEIERLRVK